MKNYHEFVGWVACKVREGETGNPSRNQPGLRGTRREGGLGRYPAWLCKHFKSIIELCGLCIQIDRYGQWDCWNNRIYFEVLNVESLVIVNQEVF